MRPLPSHSGRRWTLAVALLFTLLNAMKPLVIDDTAYFYYADQIRESPTDPYGFEIFWYEVPEPASAIIAPPLLPYWWAGAMWVFGDRPALWKLSLFPFALLLAVSLRDLLSHFARGLETPLLCMTLFSPFLLPSFNLMLDVPALALGLAALALFLRACDGDSFTGAALAGLVAGLAMQTKYSAGLTTGALLVYAALFGRWRLGLVAGLPAAALFVTWEVFVALRYGESQFWSGVALVSGWDSHTPLGWVLGLLSLLGSAGLAVAALGLLALRRGTRLPSLAAALGGLSLLLLPLLERARAASALPNDPGATLPERVLFTGLGSLVAAALLSVVWRLIPASDSARAPGALSHAEWAVRSAYERRLDLFLVAWFAIEVAGVFALSPFLALRRVIALLVVSTLLVGRLAARSDGARVLARPVRWVAAWGVLLGLVFGLTDLFDARVREEAVRRTADRIAELGADRQHETIWFVGHWGFQFHAERDGMRPLVPGRSKVDAGDWLVAPERVYTQNARARTGAIQAVDTVSVDNPWPWSTLPWAYDGVLAIRGQPTAPLDVAIYRILERFDP